ncbi:SDR family NAD(P)-dependent oxidoreductase [Amycolatopsis sp. NPDC003861]
MTKTALVTGMDTSVIAKSICSSLVRRGYSVVATSEGKFDEGKDDRVAFEAEHSEFPKVAFETVDFSSQNSIDSLITRLSKHTFEVVVNCAAILATKPDGALRNESAEFDYAEFSRVIQYNVTAVAAICLGLKDHICPGGTIVNVTSSAAQEGAFATISYNAGKAAVDSLTKSLANTLGTGRGIRVNSVAPGWIPASGDVAEEGVVALANALTPSQSVGDPQNVVMAVNYLIENKFQNGAILPVDGGITSSYLPYMLESLQLQGVQMDETIELLTSRIAQRKNELRSVD